MLAVEMVISDMVWKVRSENYAAAIVVTVPLDPRYLSAPDSTYNCPMPAGELLGAVPLAMPMILAAEVPKAVTPTPRFPLVSMRARSVGVNVLPAVRLVSV